MTPAVSAGSNQVGASDTWTANVICPAGVPARPSSASARPSVAPATGRESAIVSATAPATRGARRRRTMNAALLDQAVELPRVLTGDFMDDVGGQMAELLLDVLRRLRPDAVGVRVVGGPHERLHAHLV